MKELQQILLQRFSDPEVKDIMDGLRYKLSAYYVWTFTIGGIVGIFIMDWVIKHP